MNDSILAKYTTKRDGDDTLPPETDGADDLGSFGWLRGVRDRALMLELRHRDGNVTAFGYAWLERAEFDPSEGITLHFAGKTVKILGRNLNAEFRPTVRLLAGILRHRVPWVQEADQPTAMTAPNNTAVVERIDIKEKACFR